MTSPLFEDEVDEFYRRILMLVHAQRSTIAGRYHGKQFTAGGLHIKEVIRTPEIELRPRMRPQVGDNYQLQVEEGDGIRGNVILYKRRIPSDAEYSFQVQESRILAYLPIIRSLTVLDELASA